MLGKTSFRFIYTLVFFTSQSLAFEYAPNMGDNDFSQDFEARIDPIVHKMVLRMNEMQNRMEKMERLIEHQAQLLEDQKYAIERVNGSVGANSKYRGSVSDVIFAANVRLEGEYFLPVGITVSSYNQVVINVGNHFDPFTGAFYAPHSGVYEFWIDGMTEISKHGRACIQVNGISIKEFGDGDASGINHVGLQGSVVINLSAYDEVSMFIVSPDDSSNKNAIYGYGLYYFMFAGRSL